MRNTYPAHRINRRLSQFMIKVVSLDETDAMLSCHGTLHFHSTFDHPMDYTFGNAPLTVTKQENRYIVSYVLPQRSLTHCESCHLPRVPRLFPADRKSPSPLLSAR